MANWTYRCYVDGKSPTLWQRWYDANEEYRGTHDSTFDILEQLESWREPQTKKLKNCDGIIEVRLNGKVQHRIFGFYGEVRQQFIIVDFGYHKQSIYTPKGVLARSIQRMKEIIDEPAKAVACDRPE